MAGAAMLGLSNSLLGIAGTVFNFVVVKGVFQFSTILGNSPGILVAWKILRDIGNMVLLFGFIFMGLNTILDLHSFPTKKAIPRLIIFAVLMNFSLFAAEAIIDISNVFSTVMYTQANTDPCTAQGTDVVSGTGSNDIQANLAGECGLNYGLAGHIMETSGLSTIFSTKVVNPGFPVYAGLSLFALIGAFVLFAAAIMLAIRTVTLTFLMVLAPLGFAGMAIPSLQGAASKWWKTLLNQAFFAPVLLLLLLVSLKVADGFGTVGGDGLAGALSQPNVSTMGVFFVFILIMGFLLISLKVAKDMGAMGADFATKTAGKASFGVTGFVGRRTFGRASAKVAQKVRNSKLGETDTGRLIATTFDKGAHASFDMRGTKVLQGTGKAMKLDFGKAQKGGFHHEVDEGKKVREKYAGTLKMSKEEEAEDKRLKAEGKNDSEAWKKRKKDLDQQINDQQTKVDNFDEAGQRKKLEDGIKDNEARAVEALRRGDTAAAVGLQGEANKLKEDLADLGAAAKRNAAELNNLRSMRESEERSFNDREKDRKSKIEQNNPSVRYANNMANYDHSLFGRTAVRVFNGPGQHSRHEAVESIKKNANKSKTDKAFDAIKEEMKKKDKDDHGDDGDHDGGHAPAPKPAAGGGGGGGGGHH